MIIRREYPDEELERICHVVEHTAADVNGVDQIDLVAIDEDHLSWFYIAPGSELSALGRQLLTLACDLLGSGYWAVVQTHDLDPRALINRGCCHVVESYVDMADSSGSINVHIVQAR